MKKIFFIPIVLILSGCVTAGQSPAKTLTRYNHVSTGMTVDQVEAVIGETVVVGYDVDQETGRTSPITEKSLQREQKIQKNGRMYDVKFYLTHIRQSDDRVTDDELTPFIFEDGRLKARGWYYLDKLAGH